MKAQLGTEFAAVIGLALSTMAVAAEPTVQLNYRYEEAKTNRLVRGSAVEAVPTTGDTWKVTDDAMVATVLVSRLAGALETSLKDFEKVCNQEPAIRPFGRGVSSPQAILPRPIPRPVPMPDPETPASCLAERMEIAETLLKTVSTLQDEWSDAGLKRMATMEEALDITRKLAKNMKDGKVYQNHPVMHRSLGGGGFGGPALMAAAGGLNVGTGGAQDYGSFRKIVGDGYVPKAENFVTEGFLAEFDLSLPIEKCDEMVCMRPGIVVNKDASKMYVQLAMGSKETLATFKRAPLNLSLVLDISGSMSATDDTEKNRLEWAKDALVYAVEQLNVEDYVSIILFDSESQVLVPATQARDKKAIIAKLKALKTGGSTNVHAGLVDGYTQITKHQDDLTGYENRVILISDAGLNTGVTDESVLTKLVGDYGSQKVGLTAIGLGLNFNQSFIDGIANSQGGNYIFVHSGKDMLRYFESFNYLVTPVAYNLRANLTIEGVDAKLVKAYGVPAQKGQLTANQKVQPLVNVPTLFFSINGGAIVLEYDLKN